MVTSARGRSPAGFSAPKLYVQAGLPGKAQGEFASRVSKDSPRVLNESTSLTA